MANHLYALANGRSVGISAAGDPMSKRLVVLCHPTPGAGGFDPNPAITARWGIHVLMLDRPGYGASEPLLESELPTFESRADDLASFLTYSERDAREVGGADFGTIGVVGWGSGGAVALSLAARYPDLVDRVAVVGLPAATDAGLVAQTRRGLGLSRFDAYAPPSRLMAVLGAHEALTPRVLGIDSDDRTYGLNGLRGRVDRMLAESVLRGPGGIATDLLAMRDRGWAEQLPLVTASTLLVYGDHGMAAAATQPPGRARKAAVAAARGAAGATVRDGHWYARRIPNARVVRVVGGTELTLVSEWRRILEHVAPDTRRPEIG